MFDLPEIRDFKGLAENPSTHWYEPATFIFEKGIRQNVYVFGTDKEDYLYYTNRHPSNHGIGFFPASIHATKVKAYQLRFE